MWEAVGDWSELQYTDPHSYDHQRFVFLVRQDCSTGGLGPTLQGAGFLYCILSQTGLIFKLNWLPVFTELYNSSIAHSIFGFDRHQAEITVMQFTGHSLPVHHYDCTMEFYLVPYCQSSPPTRCLPITAIGMCHFFPVHHFGMACLAGSKVNIQHLNV